MEEKPKEEASYTTFERGHQHRPVSVRRGRFNALVSTVFIIIAALGLALALIAFVFQSYQVDGPSMENTLQNNDRLIVWKVPRTWSHITGHAYVPDRGDIIIFNENGLAQFGQYDVKQLVKRVIGLPGDRVVIKEGHITVYNQDHTVGFNPDTTLPYGKKYVMPYTSANTTSNVLDVTLGANQIFVCGDNRPDSLDSRSFGPVNVDDIIGKLVLRIYPLGTAERF